MRRRETPGESGFPPWSRRIARARREIRIPRVVSQAPLWDALRQTPTDEEKGLMGSCRRTLTDRRSIVRSDRESLGLTAISGMPVFEPDDFRWPAVWRERYQSGACEPRRRIRISLRAFKSRLGQGGNPDLPPGPSPPHSKRSASIGGRLMPSNQGLELASSINF